MEMILIKENSKEWEFMWDWIAKHPINNGLNNPDIALSEDKKIWQYMGSLKQNNEVLHQFQHLNHPLTNKKENIVLKASETISDNDIEKVLSIK